MHTFLMALLTVAATCIGPFASPSSGAESTFNFVDLRIGPTPIAHFKSELGEQLIDSVRAGIYAKFTVQYPFALRLSKEQFRKYFTFVIDYSALSEPNYDGQKNYRSKQRFGLLVLFVNQGKTGYRNNYIISTEPYQWSRYYYPRSYKALEQPRLLSLEEIEKEWGIKEPITADKWAGILPMATTAIQFELSAEKLATTLLEFTLGELENAVTFDRALKQVKEDPSFLERKLQELLTTARAELDALVEKKALTEKEAKRRIEELNTEISELETRVVELKSNLDITSKEAGEKTQALEELRNAVKSEFVDLERSIESFEDLRRQVNYKVQFNRSGTGWSDVTGTSGTIKTEELRGKIDSYVTTKLTLELEDRLATFRESWESAGVSILIEANVIWFEKARKAPFWVQDDVSAKPFDYRFHVQVLSTISSPLGKKRHSGVLKFEAPKGRFDLNTVTPDAAIALDLLFSSIETSAEELASEHRLRVSENKLADSIEARAIGLREYIRQALTELHGGRIPTDAEICNALVAGISRKALPEPK